MSPLREEQALLPTERVEVRPGRVLAIHHRAGRFVHHRPGDVAIFVHGSCASLVHWRAQIEHMAAAGLAVVAYDFLGCGRSAKPHKQQAQSDLTLAARPSLRMLGRLLGATLAPRGAWVPKRDSGSLLTI